MNQAITSRGVTLAVICLGIVAASATAVTGIVLADLYRPHASVEAYLLPPAVQQSDRWTDWHRLSVAALFLCAAAALPLLLWVLRRAGTTGKRAVFVVAAGATALIMAILTGLTRPLVEWDQLALSSVTVGTDLSGYWYAGFGDDVRFILTNGGEVSQGQYALALLPHLAAPFVGAVAFVVAAALVARSSSTPPTSPSASGDR